MPRRKFRKRSRGSIRRRKTFGRRRNRRMKRYSSRNWTKKALVMGLKRRLNNKPELKFAVTESDPALNANLLGEGYSFRLVWDCNGWIMNAKPPSVGAQRCINPPTPGVQVTNYIGQQINALSATVNIQFELNFDVTKRYEMLRVVVARPKTGNYRNGVNYPHVPLSVYGFFDTQQWKIMYDKIWTLPTGVSTSTSLNLARPAKYLQFKIPLKKTINVCQVGDPTLEIGRFFWDFPVCILALSQFGMVNVTKIFTKFWYRDP